VRPSALRVAASAVLLATLATTLILLGRFLVSAFPVDVEIVGSGTDLTLTVDGTTQQVSLSRPVVAVRPVAPPAHRREHLVDGSDSTNMLTFDPEYLDRVAGTPYVAMQSWLREEWRYSRWVGLVVLDGTGRRLVDEVAPRDSVPLPLPDPFRLTIALERPEIPRALEFIDAEGGVQFFEINRNDKFVRIGPGRSHDGADLAFWYFPREILPAFATLADLLIRVLTIALALVLAVGSLAFLLPAPARWQPGQVSLWMCLPFGVVGFLVLGTTLAVVTFDRAPHILDALAYLFQAKTFASGALSVAPAPLRDAFPVPFSATVEDRWFVQYPPGTAALLAIGVLLDVPWLVQPILGAGAIALVVRATRRQYGPGTALVVLVLAATSPFLILNAGAFLSHVPAMFFASVVLYGVTRYAERPTTTWALLVGFGLGLALLTREVVAVLYGLTLVTAGLSHGAATVGRNGRALVADVVAALGPVLAAGIIYVGYNTALTGDPLVLPRLLVDGRDRYGFGQGVGFYNEHTPAAGLVNTEQQLVSLSILLAGWPFGFSLALPLLPFLLRRWSGWDLAHGGLVAAYVLSYAAYYYHGIAFGPRYYFEALPSLLILTARGFWALAAAVTTWLAGLGYVGGWWRAQQAALIVGTALLACNLLYFLPRQFDLYHGYSGIPGKNPVLDGTIVRTLGGRASSLDNALVVSSDWWVHLMYFSALNCPRLDCPTVFAFANDELSRDALRQAFPDRTWHDVHERIGTLYIERAEPQP